MKTVINHMLCSVIIIFIAGFVQANEESFDRAEESTFQKKIPPGEARVLLASAMVGCADNRVKKNKSKRDCELILNYNPETFEVYLLKLYKRGTTDSDMNDMVRNPTKYKDFNKFIDYSSQIKLGSREKVTGINARFSRFKRDKKNKKRSQSRRLVVDLNIDISNYRDRNSDDVIIETDDEPVDYDNLDPEIRIGRRTVTYSVEVSNLTN